MDARPGTRLRARGLTWDVLEVDRTADRERFSLRCVEGDMAGLDWDIYVPPEHIELVKAPLDPTCPAPLPLWHLMHRAHLLNEIPDGSAFLARHPGRVRIEPYQLVPLMRALDMPRPRLLLADGVGLGKTIEASLIAAELIARRRAHRILIVAPSGPLLWQWEQETRLRFGLKFTLVTNAAELWEVRRAHELGANAFNNVSLCITALDFAKQEYVLEELERSAWDLVIIDEAHHCVGPGPHASQESTYRRRLAEVLARRADGLLLLTATPHDGHEPHFASLIGLLDPCLVDGSGNLIGREYRRHVIRRMKIHVRDPYTGAPLFRRRQVVPVKVDVDGEEHETVRDFHRALSAFVVPRLRRRAGGDDSLAFVSLLKRSVSTVAACLETLRVVAERLAAQSPDKVEAKAARRERARVMRVWRQRVARLGSLAAVDEANLDKLEIESMAESLRIEPDTDLRQLIILGMMAEENDPKLSTLVMEIRLIRMSHPQANILIYTEYTDSQLAAARMVRSESLIEGEVLTIGGQDDDRARAAAAIRFAEDNTLILISTDSLAEGLNLHRQCFHLIHLDLPYNPNRLEQRNGRIDRYGQRQEPQIRYLYLPGTFEESLLLRLIAKYERARSILDVMPDTLGATASPKDYDAPLMGVLSEDPGDLFKSDNETIRTLDRAVGDSRPEAIDPLLREIDRAFDTFDLMAVSHGWHGMRGFSAGIGQLTYAERLLSSSDGLEDLPEFVDMVITTEISQTASTPNEIRLPADWTSELEGLPGFDSTAGVLRFTRDFDIWRDHSERDVSFLGRAHPLVLRAIRHGCRLPGAVGICHADHLGLLATIELEIRAAHRALFRQIIAVLMRPNQPAIQVEHWLNLGATACAPAGEGIWERCFASWSSSAWPECEILASQIASEKYEAFIKQYDKSKFDQDAQRSRLLRVTTNHLCGPFVAPTIDIFGEPGPDPSWRHQEDPLTRLISFATDPETSVSKRREANDVLETFQEHGSPVGLPGPILSRQIGMLMLVPRDVR
jgi:superfamily II DNA or RNA helicase